MLRMDFNLGKVVVLPKMVGSQIANVRAQRSLRDQEGPHLQPCVQLPVGIQAGPCACFLAVCSRRLPLLTPLLLLDKSPHSAVDSGLRH